MVRSVARISQETLEKALTEETTTHMKRRQVTAALGLVNAYSKLQTGTPYLSRHKSLNMYASGARVQHFACDVTTRAL